jgi:hypothetical protein
MVFAEARLNSFDFPIAASTGARALGRQGALRAPGRTHLGVSGAQMRRDGAGVVQSV